MPTDIELLRDTKLLFGLRTSQQIILTVVGQPKRAAPDLWILCNEQSTYTVISYDHDRGRWTATLPTGDHVVRMDAPGDSWFDGEITFDLSVESTVVVFAPGGTSQPTSWVTSRGVVNDPKYPSPPVAALRPVVSTGWLCKTLQSLYGRLAPRRGGGDLRALLSHGAPSTDRGA